MESLLLLTEDHLHLMEGLPQVTESRLLHMRGLRPHMGSRLQIVKGLPLLMISRLQKINLRQTVQPHQVKNPHPQQTDPLRTVNPPQVIPPKE